MANSPPGSTNRDPLDGNRANNDKAPSSKSNEKDSKTTIIAVSVSVAIVVVIIIAIVIAIVVCRRRKAKRRKDRAANEKTVKKENVVKTVESGPETIDKPTTTMGTTAAIMETVVSTENSIRPKEIAISADLDTSVSMTSLGRSAKPKSIGSVPTPPSSRQDTQDFTSSVSTRFSISSNRPFSIESRSVDESKRSRLMVTTVSISADSTANPPSRIGDASRSRTSESVKPATLTETPTSISTAQTALIEQPSVMSKRSLTEASRTVQVASKSDPSRSTRSKTVQVE